MTTAARRVIDVLLLIGVSVVVHAQNGEWTVRYFEGKSGALISLSECELVSVTSDSLYVTINGRTVSLRLHLIYELTHPNDHNSYVGPILIGAAIGVAGAFLGGWFVEGPGAPRDDEPISRAQVAAFFGVIGAGLGLENALDAEYITYRFPSVTNPEKRMAIQRIIGEEKGEE